MSEILDFLYLGNVDDAKNKNILKYLQIKNIINVAKEYKHIHLKDFTCMEIPLRDNSSENISVYFDITSNFIEKCRQNNEKVLVHCIMGISRSTTIILAYLMKYNNMTLLDAYYFVKKKRSIINPNDGFIEQLLNYEKILGY